MPAHQKSVSSPTHHATRSSSSMDGPRRTSRSGSVLVLPEASDIGKPKLFARQSFLVTADNEAMAETILEARKLAIERRRSVADDGGVHALARRASADEHEAAAAAAASSSAAAAAEEAPKPRMDERRRSSVIQILPPHLRALMQQSDENGVQQKWARGWPALGAALSRKLRQMWDAPPPSLHHQLTNVAESPDVEEASTRTPRNGGGGDTSDVASTHDDDGAEDGQRDGGRLSLRAAAAAAAEESLLGPQPKLAWPGLRPKRFVGRKLLVLDLDETLVHSSFKPVPKSDYILDIMVDDTPYKLGMRGSRRDRARAAETHGRVGCVFVLKRPGVDEFLERVSKDYEVIIFTASLPQYANPLLDRLDPKGLITARLFREHCTFHEGYFVKHCTFHEGYFVKHCTFHEGYFVKDLTLLRNNTNLSDTIIVDNSPMAYMFQPDNAIDCTSWLELRRALSLRCVRARRSSDVSRAREHEDPMDEELYVIAAFLERIRGVPEVRDYVEFWREGSEVMDPAYA
ncbi:HAD-like domain-containing protein [Tribonema minus]|uniref:Mitochondrial import inner membrane translocase subunit TIM50 n=1 Tax=Tribonema minus TaxID=303371 RepID=A0A835YRL6_9STRA|nr:HAD-like domain-containing protein [Tribonema minus]